MPLRKGRTYEFSAQLRASGIRGGVVSVAVRNTRDWSECGLTAEIAVSDGWTACRKVFTATQDTTANSRLQIWFTEPGTLDLRDVRISEYAEATAKFTDVTPAGSSRNLLRNGSFENGTFGWSSIGTGTGWGNLTSLHGTIEKGSAADGDSFLRIPLGPGETPELGVRLLPARRSAGVVTPGSQSRLDCG